eukprot:4414389-Pyramimonas_sp.AAC.1
MPRCSAPRAKAASNSAPPSRISISGAPNGRTHYLMKAPQTDLDVSSLARTHCWNEVPWSITFITGELTPSTS